ncbi:WASH complex, partial [Aphelenchoides avenae]
MFTEPQLSFLTTDLDLSTVAPLDLKKIVPIINEFLLRSCDILNDFAVKMERRIIDFEERLDRLETDIVILEKKLENVGVAAPQNAIPAAVPPTQSEPPQSTSTAATTADVRPSEAADATQPVEREAKPAEEEAAPTGLKYKDHPLYAKYFKMLKLGVPEPAVRQKMSTEGMDPSIL